MNIALHSAPAKRKHRLISFSGMDGSGKSTQIEALCRQLSEAGIPVLRLAFWDNVVGLSKWRAAFSHKFLKSDGRVGEPGKPAHRHDKNNRAWYLLAARSVLYLIDALNLRRVVGKARNSEAGVIVFDRYIYDQLATLPMEWPVVRAYARLVLSCVPKPDVAYLLDAEPEVARERKPEYPLDFLHKYRSSYLLLQDVADLTLIEPQSQADAQVAIAARLQQCNQIQNVSSGFTGSTATA
jgi:thymidylate kinase